MPERFQRVCREGGCMVRTNSRSGYCLNHEKDNTQKQWRAIYDKERHADPVQKLYTGIAWERIKNMLRARGNVICQRRGCMHFVEIYHHIISPREDPTLMYAPRNIVGVCRQHHPNTEGEPKENLGRLDEVYRPTIWADVAL